ncbi:putative DNA-binding protein [Algoriphagus boseongensis]|uniref:Putative DNA-binding protein n=1 Tax=Algoriphagus boseongensis TaxID=1442587 RepID=A0A4R6T802_9BACT|nr:ATP-binding protein [Algoriphagus boseongensis]TDQ18816.1 putative DNA-binding protein [Algoriphagus boseongensis]
MNSTKFNQEFIKNLIRQKEGKLLDFKLKITSREKIAKTISAFANSEGGMLLIGVSDKKEVIGIDPYEEQYMIESANEMICEPHASVSYYPIKWTKENPTDFEDEELIVLLVKISPQKDGLVYCKSGSGERKAYKRSGDKTLLISDSD